MDRRPGIDRHPAEVLTTTEARQASPRRMNLYVLIGSLVLALVAAVVLYAFVFTPGNSISAPQTLPDKTTAPPQY
jgi:hypothetical protein